MAIPLPGTETSWLPHSSQGWGEEVPLTVVPRGVRGETTSNFMSFFGGQVASSSVLPVTKFASSPSLHPLSGRGEGGEGRADQSMGEEGDDTPAHVFVLSFFFAFCFLCFPSRICLGEGEA